MYIPLKTKAVVDSKILRKTWTFLVYGFALVGFVFVSAYFAMRMGFTKERGVIDNQESAFMTISTTTLYGLDWSTGDEWSVLKQAILKDSKSIRNAATDAGVPSRMVIAMLVPEQLRLFHDERELFKKVFAPLQILVNQNQFSWGIMGIKQDTAITIERNLKLASSSFYIGKQYENILDFKSNDRDAERFARITDDKDHYYGYLYAALYLKEIINQWKTAGYDISERPEILGTLYNIGFDHSHPNADPQSGGALIQVNDQSYSFGTLAKSFYDSEELPEFSK